MSVPAGTTGGSAPGPAPSPGGTATGRVPPAVMRRELILLAVITAAGVMLGAVQTLRRASIHTDSVVFLTYAQRLAWERDPAPRHPKEPPRAPAMREALDAAAKWFPWVAVLETELQHPGFPALVALTEAFLRPLLPADNLERWKAAGTLPAAAAGAVLTVLVWWLGRMVTGRMGPSLVGAAAVTVLPHAIDLRANVMSDLPAAVFATASLCAGLRVLRGEAGSWGAAACGGLAGLGWLVRPEAAVPGVAVGLMLLGRVAVGPGRLRAVAAGLCVALPALALAAPYLVIRGSVWTKKSRVFEPLPASLPPSAIDRRVGPAPHLPSFPRGGPGGGAMVFAVSRDSASNPPHPVCCAADLLPPSAGEGVALTVDTRPVPTSAPQRDVTAHPLRKPPEEPLARFVWAVGQFAVAFGRAITLAMLPLAGLGLLLGRRELVTRADHGAVFVCNGLTAAGGIVLVMTAGYVDHRHALPAAILLGPWIGIGVTACWSAARDATAGRWRRRGAAVLLAGCVGTGAVITTVRMVRQPPGHEVAAMPEMGRVLSRFVRAGEAVFDPRRVAAFEAGLDEVNLYDGSHPRLDADYWDRRLRLLPAPRWLVVSDEHLALHGVGPGMPVLRPPFEAVEVASLPADPSRPGRGLVRLIRLGRVGE